MQSTAKLNKANKRSANNSVKPFTHNCNNQSKLNTRASKFFCGERLACRGLKPEAQYKCEECASFQCQVCEELLHESADLVTHDRVRLISPPLELICENHCETRNYSDVHCVECNRNLCFTCDRTVHSSAAKRRHLRKPFERTDDKLDEEEDEFLSCEPIVSANKEQTSVAVETLTNIDLDNSGSDDNESLPKLAYNEAVKKSAVNHKRNKKQRPSSNQSLPDVAQLSLDQQFDSTIAASASSGINVPIMATTDGRVGQSFLLVNENELLQVNSSDEFAAKLGCSPSALIKVVSIFGNTGEGKSHTLNYTFFDGKELYKTSPTQNSCTIGIWCAYDPNCKVIAIDTEGLLGVSENNNRRTRLLLKVLAISDIIIYRTRAERLHNDLFTFLGDASRAYVQHFSKELKAASQRCNLSCPLSDLGPTVVIFHETVHTETLRNDNDLTPEDIIRKRFQALSLSTEAFSAFEYVGTQTVNPPTKFDILRETVKKHLKNSTVRSPRTSTVVFTALKLLNEKFSGEIIKTVLSTFPDEYFTCTTTCLSCNARCTNPMNHEGLNHTSTNRCRFQHQFNNLVYFCRACNDRGEHEMVIPKTSCSYDSTWVGIAKYAWSGFVLECRACGVIYRSRQYWYGNKDPTEQTVVRTEILHVWPGESVPSHGAQNAAQRILDSVSSISETVSTIGAKPSKMITSWVADQIAPSYWVPNAQILHCKLCEKTFEENDDKHHCRSCGEGFCDECSSKIRPVPERGWGDQPVRVCDTCYEKGARRTELGNPEVTARMVGEVIHSTLGTVVSAIEAPLGWIKDSARPEYWVPDKDITHCIVCRNEFNEKLAIHHCRACGQGVCDKCSPNKMPVPSRGWDQSVRVCLTCESKMQTH